MAFRADPWHNHYFALYIGNLATPLAHFHECSGLKSSAQVFEIEEGGLNGRNYRRPGQSRWENIILKQATNVTMDFLEWRDSFLQDQFGNRKDGAIAMMDEAGREIRRFEFHNAFPVSWEGPTLKSGGSELAVETLEIAHEGLKVIGGNTPLPAPPPTPESVPEQLRIPPIPFDYDSDELTPEGKAIIAQASKDMDTMNIEEIWLEGHTSTSGTFGYNADLAGRRAEAVKRELATHNATRKVYTQSFGWKYPVAQNNTTYGMAANRRTDFFTTSYDERGRDPSPVQPENSKYDPPYYHLDEAAASERQGN